MNQEKPSLAAKPTEPQPGEVLVGKYELRRVVGRGGFGLVYDALHLGIGRQVALKVLLPEWANQDPELAIRFRREAVLASQLRHPNTITIYDYGQTQNNILFMAMEFVDGRTLSAVLREEAPLDAKRVVHILEQILASLHEAHERGIIHRDLKPGNIMLTSHRGDTEFVKVLDFGIAKAISPDLLRGEQVGRTLTQVGQFCGTPRYMAPEQFRNGKVTPACDLYSVGLISYELLTGKPAVVGETMVDLIVSQVTGPSLTLPTALQLPNIFCKALHKAMRKDPIERFTDALSFLTMLEAWDIDEPFFTEDEGGEAHLDDSIISPHTGETGVLNLSEPPDFKTFSLPVIKDRFPDPFAPTPAKDRKFPDELSLEDLENTNDFEDELETGPQNYDPPKIFSLEGEMTDSARLGAGTARLAEPITEEVITSQQDNDETNELIRSAIVSDIAQTVDLSRKALFDGGVVPRPKPELPSGVRSDSDATVDMPIDYYLVEKDLEHGRRSRKSPKAMTQPHASVHYEAKQHHHVTDPHGLSESNWHIRAVYTVGMVIILALGTIIVIQATRFAWNNGLASRLGQHTRPSVPPPQGSEVVLLENKPSLPITITIKSTPAGATVLVNDKKIGETPVLLTASKGKNARLQVKLKDHIGYATELRFRRNRMLEVKLTPNR